MKIGGTAFGSPGLWKKLSTRRGKGPWGYLEFERYIAWTDVFLAKEVEELVHIAYTNDTEIRIPYFRTLGSRFDLLVFS